MKKILVVIDMQYDFIEGMLGSEDCRAVILNVVDIINSNKYDEIYLTRDTHNHEYLNTQEGKKLPIPHCIEYSDGWKIIDEVITAVEDKPHKIIDKNTFGSLYLANLLRETYFIEQEDIEIDICGIDTEICVISNAMIIKAAMPESKLCVIEKACAGTNKKFHDNAISAMQMCQIDII